MSRQTAMQIEQEASEWLLRIDREGRTPELLAELDDWLVKDRRRQGAWLQAEAVWALLDGLAERDVPEAQARPTISRRWLIAGGGAALAASLAGGFVLLPAEESYTTEVGEIRRVPLADGSTAAINTKSRVAIAYTPERRIVRIEEGEAFFQVAHDRARPFLVEAGRIRVQAVGTAFSVRRRDNGAEILVTEGIVEAWADGAEGARVRLSAGGRAFVADDAGVTRAQSAPSEVDRALAWRAGRIDLAGETLAHAAAEFNRYSRRPIVIADPRIAQERFYGVFRTDDPEGFALSVNQSLNVPVRADATEIRIGRPPS